MQVDPTPSRTVAFPDALAVDAVRDRVYLSTYGPLAPGPSGLALRGPGTLWVLDARTGQVRRGITVGVAPQVVAVEAGSGRVVVANAGGEVAQTVGGWGGVWVRRLRSWLPWLGSVIPAAPSLRRVPGSVSVLDPRGL